jgi:hypothetical protein
VTTEGIDAIFLETHNWGRTVQFFQALGFKIDFATDHASGQLSNGTGPAVFVAEVPEDRAPTAQLVLKVPDASVFEAGGAVEAGGVFEPGGAVEVVTPFAETHYGTREMIVRDPDGRLWNLQASR